MAKRGQGEGTISKRPDGTWWARITVGKDAQGKQKRKAFYGKTRKEVQEKLTAALNDINNDTYIEPANITVEQWLATWIDEYKRPILKPKTYVGYKEYIKIINLRIGSCKVKALKNDDIQKFVNRLTADGYAPKTVKEAYGVLKMALDQAVINEMVARSPIIKVTLPKRQAKQVRVLDQAEQERFIDCAKGEKFGEAVTLLLYTGLRLGELLALTWNDIDYDGKVIAVNKNLTRYEFTEKGEAKQSLSITTPKTEAGTRKIPIIPETIELLESMKKQLEEDRRIFGEEYNPGNRLLYNSRGGVLGHELFRKQLRIIAAKAEVDWIYPHALRHTFATRGLEKGIPLKVMQEILGHSDLSVTANIYTHVLPDTKIDYMMKLSETTEE